MAAPARCCMGGTSKWSCAASTRAFWSIPTGCRVVSRGKVELNLSIQAVTAADTVVTVNWPLAQGYRDALRDLAQRMELPDDLTAGMVARFPDVLAQTAAPANEDELWQDVQAVAQQETDSAQLAEELATLSARLDDERTALKTAQDSHFAVDATMQEAKARIDALEEDIREREKSVSEARSTSDNCWRAHSTSEMRLERTTEKLNQFEEQLLEAFGFSPDVAIAEADLELDTKDAPARLKTLKNKIARLGEINFTALEEYERVSEQAAFLQTQLEDLSLARTEAFGAVEVAVHEL